MMQPGSKTQSKSKSGLGEIAGSDFGYAQARHLLWRAGFGGTPTQIQSS